MLMVPPWNGGGAGRALRAFCHIVGGRARSPIRVQLETDTVTLRFGVSFFHD